MLIKPQEPGTVMIVDDNSVSLLLSRKIIEKTNTFKEIISFQNPLKAMEFLKEASNGLKVFPDLILLDLQMPEMNGFEFLDEIKEFPEDYTSYCSIFILTSSFDQNDAEKIREIGKTNNLLSKPLTLESFLPLINELYPNFDYSLHTKSN